MELLGLALVAVLFIATIAIVLVRFSAAVMRASTQAKPDPTEARLTDLRLLLQHNDTVSPLALQFMPDNDRRPAVLERRIRNVGDRRVHSRLNL